MTVLRLARSELKRMTGGVLPKLTIVALSLVPLLYGAIYLYANWDPYNNLSGIKAALVVEDTGATPSKPDGSKGEELQAGTKVADSLVDAHLFDWQRVATSQEADDGVRTGKYAFALKIPADFSKNLVSPSTFDSAHQAMLNVTTNDANNYLLSTIVDKLTTAVHSTVAQEVGQQTADQLLTGFGVIHQNMVKAADGAKNLADGLSQLQSGATELHQGTGTLVTGAQQLVDGQGRLVDGANQLSSGASTLSSGLSQLNQGAAQLPSSTKQLADGAAQVAAGNAQLNSKVQGAVQQLQGAETKLDADIKSTVSDLVAKGAITQAQADTLLADLQKVQSSNPVTDAKAKISAAAADVQKLSDGSAAVAAGARKLSDAAPALAGGISQANDGAAQLAQGAGTLAAGEQSAYDGAVQLSDGASKLDAGAAKLQDGTATAASGAKELATKLAEGSGQIPNPDATQRDSVSKVMSDPVAVDKLAQTKATTYGAGLAPFFLSLSLWIGAFMLVQAMRPLTQRALASNAPSWKIGIAGWLPFFVVSAVQTTLLWAVVTLGLKLESANPALTFVFLLFAAMAFTALIQGICALLGTPGKFVVLILLVLQLVSSGGTFPWQTTPQPFHVVHDILPLGYVVTGMRHLIYGGDLSMVAPIMLGLVGYAVLGMGMSTLAVHKHKLWTLKSFKPEISV
ncbi:MULTISPECIES: YhgE/Pip domain-containing protein [Arthrobacter]|uniref:YhgE/Pip domain-containing protein n=2 Tax=Arthrobacter TaxID=1663 RepID=A0ABU9KHT8_9MICC|nr:YhgE/Pip domain-containing protein [Arthrobacter sp. YJM1]MDP5226647.1 YhgE/Pip domain-containing protein [Arthrobacter sp. YJM1]